MLPEYSRNRVNVVKAEDVSFSVLAVVMEVGYFIFPAQLRVQAHAYVGSGASAKM
jgi:hypothetical protein